jgi:hypothetical protein
MNLYNATGYTRELPSKTLVTVSSISYDPVELTTFETFEISLQSLAIHYTKNPDIEKQSK